MNRHYRNIGRVVALAGVALFSAGCGGKPGAKAGGEDTGAKADAPRVLETVDLAPGKPISPQDQAKVSSLALKMLGHVAAAQKDIQAKKADAAKDELTKAGQLLDIVKQVLPTVKVIDHIWVTKSNLNYLNTTDVRQDLVTLTASVDQLYDLLPEGQAKANCKDAKDCLAKHKAKGAAAAKDKLDAVEEALSFREADLSVSYTSRLIKAAQDELAKGKLKEAGDHLTAVSDGLVFFDTSLVDPLDLAARRIWMATQDYQGKEYKAAVKRLGMAKTALQEAAGGGAATVQTAVKGLIAKIDALDVSKAGDKTGAALDAVWHDMRTLLDQTHPKTDKTKKTDKPHESKKTDKSDKSDKSKK